jgi:hypothetical protein
MRRDRLRLVSASFGATITLVGKNWAQGYKNISLDLEDQRSIVDNHLSVFLGWHSCVSSLRQGGLSVLFTATPAQRLF